MLSNILMRFKSTQRRRPQCLAMVSPGSGVSPCDVQERVISARASATGKDQCKVPSRIIRLVAVDSGVHGKSNSFLSQVASMGNWIFYPDVHGRVNAGHVEVLNFLGAGGRYGALHIVVCPPNLETSRSPPVVGTTSSPRQSLLSVEQRSLPRSLASQSKPRDVVSFASQTSNHSLEHSCSLSVYSRPLEHISYCNKTSDTRSKLQSTIEITTLSDRAKAFEGNVARYYC